MVVLLVILMTNIASAQWSKRKAHKASKIEASIGFRGGRDLSFKDAMFGRINLNLSNGFEFMGCYRPFDYLYTGIVLTNYAGASSAEDNSITISQTQFGLVGFLATPWSQLPSEKKKRLFYYRAKLGGILDATGLKITGMENMDDFALGRLREHRFFVSTEVGIKSFDTNGTAMFFLRLSYMRSIYSWSRNNSSTLNFDSGDNDRITFDIGISL